MDDEFDLDINTSKSKVKKGRRAKKQPDIKPSAETAQNEMATPPTEKSKPTRPSRRQMGWGNETQQNDMFDSRFQQDSEGSDSNDEIAVIPDLEDLNDDDMTQEVAAPPPLKLKNMTTYNELDRDLMNRAAFRTLDGKIDLKALVKNLSPDSECREEQDCEWEWEKLFAEVTTSLKEDNNSSNMKQTNQERIV